MSLSIRPHVDPEDEWEGEKRFIYYAKTGERFHEAVEPSPSKPGFFIFPIYLRGSIGTVPEEHIFGSLEEMDRYFTMPNSSIKRI